MNAEIDNFYYIFYVSCGNCKKRLDPFWKFCPYCGSSSKNSIRIKYHRVMKQIKEPREHVVLKSLDKLVKAKLADMKQIQKYYRLKKKYGAVLEKQ